MLETAVHILSPELLAKRDGCWKTCAVWAAWRWRSGGIDSTVVAQAAYLALADRARRRDRRQLQRAPGRDRGRETTATQIGIRHKVVLTDEFADPNYVRNDERPLLLLQEAKL